MPTIYRSISLTGKDFRTYLENYDFKNLKLQIDIRENRQRGEVFKPLSDNFIIICNGPNLRFYRCTHLIYDFDNETRFRIRAFTNRGDDQIEIIPEQIEDCTTEFSSVEFIDTLISDETERKISFWGSTLGVIYTLTTIDFSAYWKEYREYRQEWLKEYFPVRGLSDNFENSLILFSDICSYDKELLLKLSDYKINLIIKCLADLKSISNAFDSIRPHETPTNNIEAAKKQKEFIDSHKSLIFETEESLQNIYLFLNMLKATSENNSKNNKDNIFITFFKKITGSYVISKLIEQTSSILAWIQDRWHFVTNQANQIFERIKVFFS